MKKSILNIGKALNKTEQQQINGGEGDPGFADECSSNESCAIFSVNPITGTTRDSCSDPSEQCVDTGFGYYCQCV